MIRGQGKFYKLYNERKARRYKHQFYQMLLRNEPVQLVGPDIDMKLVTFSGLGETSDQMLSIFSFLKNVGIPKKWLIISDGNHNEETKGFFKRFPFVEFVDWSTQVAAELKIILPEHPSWQVKKLFTFCSLKISGTTVFLDSDILFFPLFAKGLEGLRNHNWYLSDTSGHFDPGFEHPKTLNYLNGGFMVLNEQPDVQACLGYYVERMTAGTVGYFTDQTAMQLMVLNNDFRVLDPRFFCLTTEDMFALRTSIKSASLAIRHYVGQVRFRMWHEARQKNYFQ